MTTSSISKLKFLRILFSRIAGIWSVLTLCFLPAPSALAASTNEMLSKRTVPAMKLGAEFKPPVIDGDLNDAVWKVASVASSFVDSDSGQPVEDQTEALLAYDSDYIYVGFRCHDAMPNSILARETVRDADMGNDDNVRFFLEPFHSQKWNDLSTFIVNARGTRRTSFAGGRANKLEWQGDWAAAAKRTPEGWTAEMRIPWGILTYPHSKDPQAMGINFRRYQTRTQRTSIWSWLGPQGFLEYEGIWKDVHPSEKGWKPRFSMLPYLMPSSQIGGGRSQTRIGLDTRFQPTPEFTGVATINPDFASVEGAVEGIGFTRSERYVPEKRPFFLEGRNYLSLGEDYSLGYYFDPSTITHVDTGLKAYGKINPQTTLGVMGTVGFGHEADYVTHVRREFGPLASASVMMLQHLAPGEDNTVLAFSPEVRRGKWSNNAEFSKTLGVGAGGNGFSDAFNLEDKNMFSTVRYRYVENNFIDRLGYIPFTDYKGWSTYSNWQTNWHHGNLRGFFSDFSTNYDWHIDGTPFRRQASLDFGFTTKNDNRYGVFFNGGKFDQDNDFTYGISVGGGLSNRFKQWGLDLTTGRLGSRPFTSFGPSFRARLFRKLDVAFSTYGETHDGFVQQHILTMNYELSPFRSWGGRMVIDNGNLNAYLSYHNAGQAGTDTYFIIGDPNALRFVKRVMVKFVFAL